MPLRDIITKSCCADRNDSWEHSVRDLSPHIDCALAQGFACMKVRVAAVCRSSCRRQRTVSAFVSPSVVKRWSVWFRVKLRKRKRGVHVNVCVHPNEWMSVDGSVLEARMCSTLEPTSPMSDTRGREPACSSDSKHSLAAISRKFAHGI